MSAYALLRQSIPRLSATEKRIAEYILQNSRELPQTTISTVAEACQTGKSMVVQLCKKVGFKGYKDLCSSLCVEQALHEQEQPSVYDDIHPGIPIAQLCKLTVQEELRSIGDTGELCDLDAIAQAVKALSGADRICLFGVGSSAVVALDMYNKLSRIGLNVRFSQDTHCQLLETAGLTPDSVAMIFSYNGCTQDMLDACRLAHEYQATVISMTRYGHNPISDEADIRLCVASNESLMRISAMSSRLSMLTMVDILFTCLASSMHNSIQTYLRRATSIAARGRK
ncbi:MAG: MurR/RpiR family transcriptional regulator [Clostridia bacterium]